MTNPVFRRAAVFYATEHHIKENGEWFRDEKNSSTSLTEQMNNFAIENEAEIVFASPPNIKTVEADDNSRTHFVAISIIYIPKDLIEDATLQKKVSLAEEKVYRSTPAQINISTKEAAREFFEKAEFKFLAEPGPEID